MTVLNHSGVFELFDDFVDLLSDRWQVHQARGAGGSVALINGEDDILGGVVALTVWGQGTVWGGDQHNHCLDLKLVDGDNGAPYKITKDSGKKLWYAIRLKLVQLKSQAVYVGLFNPAECAHDHGLGEDDTGEPDLSADGFLDGIYFRTLVESPFEFDWCVAKNGVQTEVEGDIAESDRDWDVLGFFFDGINTITPMINGVALPAHEILIDAVANFPDDLALLPHIYFQAAGTDLTGTHTAGNNQPILTDGAQVFNINELVGLTIVNITDGSSGVITANTGTTVTATLTGGADNDWDTNDVYIISKVLRVDRVMAIQER